MPVVNLLKSFAERRPNWANAIFQFFTICIVGVITIGAAIYGIIYENAVNNTILLELVILNILVLLLVCVSGIWLFEYHYVNKRRPQVKRYFTAREFAQVRRNLIDALNPEDITSDILEFGLCSDYWTPLNQPEGAIGQEDKKVQEANRDMYEKIGQLVSADGCFASFRVLAHAKEMERWCDEMDSKRRAISDGVMTSTGQPTQIATKHFSAIYCKDALFKDYLIIGDYVFKTIYNQKREKAGTSYIYIRDADMAASYRAWVEDIINEIEKDELVESSEKKEKKELNKKALAMLSDRQENLPD